MADFNLNSLAATLRNIVNIPELRKRMLFMFGLLALYRVGSWIPTPGVNAEALAGFFQAQSGTIFGFLDISPAGTCPVFYFCSGITPYITASIIFQLLTGCLALSGTAFQGRRSRSPQDQPVHPIRDGRG